MRVATLWPCTGKGEIGRETAREEERGLVSGDSQAQSTGDECAELEEFDACAATEGLAEAVDRLDTLQQVYEWCAARDIPTGTVLDLMKRKLNEIED